MILRNSFYLFIAISIFVSCKSDQKQVVEDDYKIVTRSVASPKGLNPTMNLSGPANDIYPLLFLPMAEYNPKTLEFEAITIESLPTSEPIESGEFSGGIQFKMRIKDEAKWEDGTDITGYDFLFSVKSILHPKTNSIRYRAFISNLANVIVDTVDPKKLTVQYKVANIAALELATSIPILPKHVYDPNSSLDDISMLELQDENIYAEKSKINPAIDSFAVVFNSPKHTRDVVIGNGRYRLKEWMTDQYISLERKDNHWLEGSTSALTVAYPKEIIYLLTPDKAAAISQLKSNQYDIFTGLTPQDVLDLKDNEVYNNKFDFHQKKVARYYFVNINARKSKLDDKRVRKALAYLMDVDTIISSYEKGLGERINSPFLSVDSKSTLEDIRFNRSKADQLLADAGWKDTNANGIVDKSIDGQLTELELDFVGTGSPLGKLISGVYKQMAASSGVKINVVNVDRTQYKQKISNLDFDLAVGGKGQSLAPYDPYSMFHTDNTDPGEGNLTNFGNEQSDQLIELIRSTEDPEVRDQAYLDLERILTLEQTHIFLYSPMDNIVVKKGWEGVLSIKKPGYAINTFRK